MKFFIRLNSLSSLACELQEITASDAHRARLAGPVAAANWGKGNGSEAVLWQVETFAGAGVGMGQWNATPPIPQEVSDDIR
jgi:hypothetical protein